MSSFEVAPFLSTHLFPQCCYNSAYIIPCTRLCVHFFHTGSYSDTVSIRTTECRRYENDIWVTVLARGNRSSPWKTRLSATLFIINVDKAPHGQVSLRISLDIVQDVSQKLGFSPLPKWIRVYPQPLCDEVDVDFWNTTPDRTPHYLSNKFT